MQKDRASQKEREGKKARDRDRERKGQCIKPNEQKGGKTEWGGRGGGGETETFGENSSNSRNGTGEVRQERRENSAVISR